MSSKGIYVTKPALPDLQEVYSLMGDIWLSGCLTNGGRYHQQLEQALSDYLAVKYVSLFCNGTTALMCALKALEIKGEVITTPFSFVATTHSLSWMGIRPVFVDVDPVYGNLCPKEVERRVTARTAAILPVHVYGHPCDVDGIQCVAKAHNLKLVYDAAHAFGVKIDGRSILQFGDLSVLSFHATKVFTTFEGGAVVTNNKTYKQRVDLLKDFGIRDETTVECAGINGKMNEIQAAIGLAQLRRVAGDIEKRRKLSEIYHAELSMVAGIRALVPAKAVEYNYAFYPIFVDESLGASRDKIHSVLREHQIYARKYFFPLIPDLPPYRSMASETDASLPHAKNLAERVICLPLYPELDEKNVKSICQIIKSVKK